MDLAQLVPIIVVRWKFLSCGFQSCADIMWSSHGIGKCLSVWSFAFKLFLTLFMSYQFIKIIKTAIIEHQEADHNQWGKKHEIDPTTLFKDFCPTVLVSFTVHSIYLGICFMLFRLQRMGNFQKVSSTFPWKVKLILGTFPWDVWEYL